tara:strand:- start:765 stop:965 length:201 start_codon:yes stop_codon:yes gene_type:complete
MIFESKRQELQDELDERWDKLNFNEKAMYVGLLSIYDLSVAIEEVSGECRSIKNQLKQLNLDNWNQ